MITKTYSSIDNRNGKSCFFTNQCFHILNPSIYYFYMIKLILIHVICN